MRVAIVGAGMAGLSCANGLRAFGLQPCLFDKGGGASGRLASRRLATPLGEVAIDMGAQFFTVHSPSFAAKVAAWAEAGLVAPWAEAGDGAWVGTPLMSSPLKAMAEGHDIRWKTFVRGISRLPDGWRIHLEDEEIGPFPVVVVAVPAEQATPLLALNDPGFMRHGARSVSAPCWTGLFAFAEPLQASASVLCDRGIFAWAARNTAKPGRLGPDAWVVQANPRWSSDHLEADAKVVEHHLLSELFSALDIAERPPLAACAHRWRFARSTGLGLGHLWSPAIGLGVCGDWLLAPRMESAWLSGFALAETIADEARHLKAGAVDLAGRRREILAPSGEYRGR